MGNANPFHAESFLIILDESFLMNHAMINIFAQSQRVQALSVVCQFFEVVRI